MKLHLDFETRSAVDLKRVGAWAYAQHPSTEITCMGFASEILPQPRVLPAAEVKAPKTTYVFGHPNVIVCAHSVPFEYAIWNFILHRRYGWPARWDPAGWSCTLARAAMVGLPLGLDALTQVLPCKTPKDLEGRRIMLQLAKPKNFNAMGEPIYDESPEKYKRLYEYNATDVLAEMEVDGFLPELSPAERKVWELDFIMNRRGVQVDLALSRKAAALADDLTAGLNADLRAHTNGAVDKNSQIQALRHYLKRVYNVETESLDKVALTSLLENPKVPDGAKYLLNLRRQAGKSSTAKYTRTIDAACSDGRVRGALQYHAAHTGRWGGRIVQPHNYPQGFGEKEQREAVNLIDEGSPTMFRLYYEDKAMEALSNTLRGTIIAGPGKKLISADYNAIEARVLFWLSNETKGLAAYRRGESPYLDLGADLYGRPITKKGDPNEYDISKRSVLGYGYGMGWKTFRDNIYMETAKKGKPLLISDELAQRSQKIYRAKYSTVPRLWQEVESAAIAAVQDPNKGAKGCCGNRVLWALGRGKWSDFLVCRLPSGRYLWYYQPKIRPVKTPWGEEKLAMTYMGEHPKTKKWTRLKTYGGLLVENIDQGISRDIMANGMLRCEAAGFDMLLTVHDELLAETDELTEEEEATYGYKQLLDDFMKEMCTLPAWADGLPIAAEGWVGERYRK